MIELQHFFVSVFLIKLFWHNFLYEVPIDSEHFINKAIYICKNFYALSPAFELYVKYKHN